MVIEFRNNWAQVFGSYNWYEFNIIQLYFENNKIHGTFEFIIDLLGFGIRVSWVYDKEQNAKKMKEYAKRIKEGELW